jgi:hypothetical protein
MIRSSLYIDNKKKKTPIFFQMNNNYTNIKKYILEYEIIKKISFLID